MARVSLNAIVRAREEVRDLEAAYLRQHGWREVCDTPGAYWMWTITLVNKRVILTTREHAVQMQARAGWQLKAPAKSEG